jgi:hypothetical protein
VGRVWVRRILVLASVLVIAQLPMPAAHAVCESEQGIFWGAKGTGGSWITFARGSYNLIRMTNRALDPDCSANVAGSTSLVFLDMDTIDWVEVGWEKNDGNTYDWFAEWGIGGHKIDRPDGGLSSVCAGWPSETSRSGRSITSTGELTGK